MFSAIGSSLRAPFSRQSPLQWIGARLLVYIATAAGAAGLFAIWATVYVRLTSAPETIVPPAIQQPVKQRPVPPPAQQPVPADLVAEVPPPYIIVGARLVDEKGNEIGRAIKASVDNSERSVQIQLYNSDTKKTFSTSAGAFKWEWDEKHPAQTVGRLVTTSRDGKALLIQLREK